MTRVSDDRILGVRTLYELANLAYRRGDLEQARLLNEECRATFFALGDEPMTSMVLHNIGTINEPPGYNASRPLLLEALSRSRETDNREHMIAALGSMGYLMISEAASSPETLASRIRRGRAPTCGGRYSTPRTTVSRTAAGESGTCREAGYRPGRANRRGV